MEITAQLVRSALRDDDDPWHIGNQVLYDLCRDYPRHNNVAEIVAKIWLIGRAYSASVERRPNADADVSNDRFYTEAVPNVLRQPQYGLDDNLTRLARLKDVDGSNLALVLDTHGRLVKCFKKLTTLSKRSLASKYLHFHLPHLFFIYDSRAAVTIKRIDVPRTSKWPSSETADPEYARFVGAALDVRKHVSSKFRRRLTPRQLDRLLLATFASDRADVRA
jgi:hypothetical protein